MTNSASTGELPPWCRSGDGPARAVSALAASRCGSGPMPLANSLASPSSSLLQGHWGTHHPGPGRGSQGQAFATGRACMRPDICALGSHFNPLALTPQSLQSGAAAAGLRTWAALYVVT